MRTSDIGALEAAVWRDYPGTKSDIDDHDGSLGAVASSQVRRAEAYVEANWEQPLTIEALALVAGVSARTLFHSFRKRRGYSPMGFVKRIRLNHARWMLQDQRNSTSVTDVALACGFGNLGHFSGYYRRAFGETPSATLRQALKA
ncbi:MAG: helix-turn-helix domain-containing protein [Bradyrhizobium sp.]